MRLRIVDAKRNPIQLQGRLELDGDTQRITFHHLYR